MTKCTFLRRTVFHYIIMKHLMPTTPISSFHLLSCRRFILLITSTDDVSLTSAIKQSAYTSLKVLTGVSGSSQHQTTISKYGCIMSETYVLFLLAVMETS